MTADAYTTPDVTTRVDVAELEAWNAGTQRAIRANRDRARRERFLDALYIYNEPAR